MKALNSETIFTKDFILLFIINFTSYAGMQLFNSILSKYAKSIGVPDAWLGLVVSAFALMIFLASLFSGLFVDRFNKKTILIISMTGQALAVLGYALISKDATVLMALRLFHGLCAGVTMTVSMSMVAFALPKTKLGMGMGIYGLGQTLAMAVGPYIGIWLVDNYGYRNMFLIAFVLVLLSAMMTLLLTSLSVVQHEKPKFSYKHLVHKKTIPTAVLGFFNCTAYSSVVAYLVIHADIQDVANIGYFFTAYSVVLLVSRPLVGRFSDRLSLKAVIYPTSILLVASMLICAYATSLWMFLLSAVLMSIGFGGSQPVIQAASIRDVAPHTRGSASGTFMMGQSLGFIVGPMAGGYAAAYLGYDNMFAIMAGIAFLSIVVITLITIVKRKKSAESPNLETTS